MKIWKMIFLFQTGDFPWFSASMLIFQGGCKLLLSDYEPKLRSLLLGCYRARIPRIKLLYQISTPTVDPSNTHPPGHLVPESPEAAPVKMAVHLKTTRGTKVSNQLSSWQWKASNCNHTPAKNHASKTHPTLSKVAKIQWNSWLPEIVSHWSFAT